MIAWDIKNSTLSKVDRVEDHLRLIISSPTILSETNNTSSDWLHLEILLQEAIADSINLDLPCKIQSGFINAHNTNESMIPVPYHAQSPGHLKFLLEGYRFPLKIKFMAFQVKLQPI